MIRTVHIPTRVNRMGLVQSGDGGSATSYTFGSTGLSNDPQLASYLQDLTAPQLQAALNNQVPSAADMGLNDNTILTTCQQNYDPAICGPGGPNSTSPLAMSLGLSSNNLLGAVPSWALWAGGALGALLIAKVVTR